ncbi:unnamed protein product [Zymoseptoria tritici ST99CH_1A5]|uniref:Uncharacterized protein n=1 Tax=Zymoseptoria tritici ST99CH_1A5 TaxID=1276529 RepID=A0A1Y6L8J4_ZYMTR|nr:unnamed protein product [Zymoseptoria tritici ST99CH_1A5]
MLLLDSRADWAKLIPRDKIATRIRGRNDFYPYASTTSLSAILASFIVGAERIGEPEEKDGQRGCDQCGPYDDQKGFVKGCYTFPAPDSLSKLWSGACTNCLLDGNEKGCSISRRKSSRVYDRPASKNTANTSTRRRNDPPLALLRRVLAEVNIADIFDGDGVPDAVSHPTSNDSIPQEDCMVGTLNIPFVFSQYDTAEAYVGRMESAAAETAEACRTAIRNAAMARDQTKIAAAEERQVSSSGSEDSVLVFSMPKAKVRERKQYGSTRSERLTQGRRVPVDEDRSRRRSDRKNLPGSFGEMDVEDEDDPVVPSARKSGRKKPALTDLFSSPEPETTPAKKQALMMSNIFSSLLSSRNESRMVTQPSQPRASQPPGRRVYKPRQISDEEMVDAGGDRDVTMESVPTGTIRPSRSNKVDKSNRRRER